MTTDPLRRLLVAAALCLAATPGCSAPSAPEDPPVNTATAHATTHSIGRFRFELPESLAVTGRSQRIYGVEVATRPLGAGGADALWKERLAAIEARRQPPGAAAALVRAFELAPGVRAAWYHDDAYAREPLRLDAMKAWNDHALLLSRRVETEDGAPRPRIEELLGIVVEAYRPGARRGFDVGSGTLVSEPGDDETALLALRGADERAPSIRFETWTVEQPDEPEPLADLLAGRGAARAAPLSSGTRAAAGLEGRETKVAFGAGADAGLRYAWEYPGRAGSAEMPAVKIVAVAHAERRADLDAAWESLLGSLRPVPLADAAR